MECDHETRTWEIGHLTGSVVALGLISLDPEPRIRSRAVAFPRRGFQWFGRLFQRETYNATSLGPHTNMSGNDRGARNTQMMIVNYGEYREDSP